MPAQAAGEWPYFHQAQAFTDLGFPFSGDAKIKANKQSVCHREKSE